MGFHGSWIISYLPAYVLHYASHIDSATRYCCASYSLENVLTSEHQNSCVCS